MTRVEHTKRSGITLLEIVLALAIAAIAMTLLTQLVGLGNRSATVARDSAKAQMVAESVMAEVMSGIVEAQSTTGTYEQDPSWSFEILVAQGPNENINVIRVDVMQTGDIARPMSYSLTQWQFIPPEPAEEETTEEDTGGAV